MLQADVAKSLERLRRFAGDRSPSTGSSGGTVIQAGRGVAEQVGGDVSPSVETGCALIGMFYVRSDRLQSDMETPVR